MEEVVVVIVGAGPSGLATTACLTLFSIPNIILEREDCSSCLWKKRAYDRLKLHLAKKFCHLPFMPHPSTTPTFISRKAFIKYMDDYASNFKLSPNNVRSVESATYNDVMKRWHIEANQKEVYVAEFLVVATGENSEGYIPKLTGLSSFRGEVIHSSEYKSGLKYHEKEVLVVGCGNSGMEIAFDLASHAHFVQDPVNWMQFHVLNKEMVYLGMFLLKYLPISVVEDPLIIFLANFKYGDLTKYGIIRPEKGPFYLKAATGRSAVIDVGTVKKIKVGQIQVFPAISSIKEDGIMFDKGKMHQFDAILFATGYKSTANNWLKMKHMHANGEASNVEASMGLEHGGGGGFKQQELWAAWGRSKSSNTLEEKGIACMGADRNIVASTGLWHICSQFVSHWTCLKVIEIEEVHAISLPDAVQAAATACSIRSMDYIYCLNNDGMPKNTFPNHWKGENGLYCVGLSRRGLFGVSMDVKAIASDIQMVINGKE
ncbi:hypothetical protein HHK36_004248 [Tetracentron sinense]|uniref:Flavin-containing monooxygenase n=1 Tax=Tetracentron sinense TaxID=13715 RepID=A0A834ZTZ1_TETSI|nr:hypothetical protein HHK36_004248 [Tetracentron sinense]